MKREGRLHGMVRTYPVLPSPWNPKSLNNNKFNKFDSRPTAGLFVKVPSKPTNHSKFTGKRSGKSSCTERHMHPSYKSKDKTKGSHKLKSQERLMTWGIVDGTGTADFEFAGFSATEMLEHVTTVSLDDYVC